jgi:Calx-beta domain/Bacterial Ig domain
MKRLSIFWLALLVAAGIPFLTTLGAQGAAPPILVVVNSASPNPYGAYLAEILRAEGINSFSTAAVSALDAPTLSAAKVVILADTPLTAQQAGLLTAYVNGGGRLIAMRPDPQLHSVLGVVPLGATTTNGYIAIDPSGPGAGLQTMTLPFHGDAIRYQLASGAQAVAGLYSDRTTSTGLAAVSRYGNTATWSYDLARSIAYARQGDPANAFERDGVEAFRTIDVFFEAVDLERVRVPHADVQMRLFARVVTALLADAMPLPKLWYFPGVHKTVMVVTADAHTNEFFPYADEFNTFLSFVQSLGGHASLYLSRYMPYPTSTQTAAWRAAGHEIGLHPYGYADSLTLDGGYQIAENYHAQMEWGTPSATVRSHMVEWQGWTDAANVALSHGKTMDVSYYTYGPSVTRPDGSQAHGYVTGSGLPMRFIHQAGSVLPVYQQVTSLIDEQLVQGPYSENLTVPAALAVSHQLIDDSQAGGYSAITTQFHIDYYLMSHVRPWVEGTLQYAASLGIPLLTTQEWLQHTQSRVDTQITNLIWYSAGRRLDFRVAVPATGRPMSVTLPSNHQGDALTTVRVDGATVSWTPLTASGQALAVIVVAPGATPRAVTAIYGNYPNNAPVANADSTGTIPGQPVTVAVLTNDSDPDGDTVTITAAGPATSGSVTVIGNNTLVQYTPAAGFCGNASFPYTVNDGRGGTATATVTVTVNCGGSIVTHTSSADFTGCASVQLIDTRVVPLGDGAVRLAGQLSDEYNGSSLDAQWVAGRWDGTPYAPVPANGMLTIGDPPALDWVRSAQTYPLTTFEVRAQFTASPAEHIGLGSLGYAGNQYLIFSTFNGTTQLYARSNMGAGEQTTPLGAIPTGFHTYRIERLPQGGGTDLIRYSIDGAVVANHSVSTIPALYIYQEAAGQTLPALTIDWIELAPAYASSGSFDSCPMDAGSVQPWTSATWSATTPSGTAVALSTRTSVDGTAWSAWSSPLTASGQAITSPQGRYLQYRLLPTTSNSNVTPVVDAVNLYHAGSAPLPSLSIADLSVNEGTGGTTTAQFTVTLSSASARVVTVQHATVDGTATAGSDYTAGSGTLTFAPGVTSRTIAVPIVADSVVESTETYSLVLLNPTNATIADGTGIGAIVDDDDLPVTATFQIAGAADDVNEDGSNFDAGGSSVWLGNAASATASYTGLRFAGVSVPGGATIVSAHLEVNADATQWNSIAFEFAAEAAAHSAVFSSTSRPSQRVLLAPRVNHASNAQWLANTWYGLNDIAPLVQGVVSQGGWNAGNALSLVMRGTANPWARKFARSFEANPAQAPRLVVTYRTGPLPPPTLSIGDMSVTEGTGGTSTATFTVTLSRAISQTVTVQVATADGTATAPGDYTAQNGPLTFAPGVTTLTVAVPIVTDTAIEASETF